MFKISGISKNWKHFWGTFLKQQGAEVYASFILMIWSSYVPQKEQDGVITLK